jgi:hypothetical protein
MAIPHPTRILATLIRVATPFDTRFPETWPENAMYFDCGPNNSMRDTFLVLRYWFEHGQIQFAFFVIFVSFG